MKLRASYASLQVAEVELVYVTRVKPWDRPLIRKASDAYALFLSYWNSGKIELVEEFKILLLNGAKRVLGLYHVSSGGMSSTLADQRLIFATALKVAASGIILCHNHPSGNLNPSATDEELTSRLKEGGNILNIPVLDHLIICSEDYYSFAEQGLL